ncbi:MAG: hypothetical protein M3Y72_06705 [Acidobacteriota bacterium]|nr:hypothetical protein [Acidobacteriota bacterium]
MKLFFQIVAAAMLLLFLGVSEADCLTPNAGMSNAEKACCRQMAGQCDMNMAATHPCCRKIVQRHNVADLKDPAHFPASALSLQAAALPSGLSIDLSTRSFVFPERLRHPAHSPPKPSLVILRI